MNYKPLEIGLLTDEYATLVKEVEFNVSDKNGCDWDALAERLAMQGGWTLRGASHLVGLVRRYGVFILRNALALGIAVGLEDGDLGL